MVSGGDVDENTQEALRRLPSVEELLQRAEGQELIRESSRPLVTEAVRGSLQAAREILLGGAPEGEWDRLVAPEGLLSRAARLVAAWRRPHLRRVINASGVVVHTNLGRSRLAEAAIERMVEAARFYTNLEYDLDQGERGSRHDHVAALLTRLTGAEAAMVVNNNAAAVLLMLSAVAAGREVVVSRGQLVEIGGSFRVPDIMRLSGARLVEVGTTNKTRLGDYESAVSDWTALLLRVHTSNFRVVGFSEEVPVEELVALGRRHGVPVGDDLGSGALIGLRAFAGEPTIAASLGAGVDILTFSGDKLLGGPQAGIVLGREEQVAELRSHPFARAVRVDKLTLAALEGTLLLYLDAEHAVEHIPTLRFMDRSEFETADLARRLQEALRARCPGMEMRVEQTSGRAGGGSLPMTEVPTHAVVIRPQAGEAAAVSASLRGASPPVIARVEHDALYLDVLALGEDEIELLAESACWALRDVAERETGRRGFAPDTDEDEAVLRAVEERLRRAPGGQGQAGGAGA